MRKISFPTYPDEKGNPQKEVGYFHEWIKTQEGSVRAIIERGDGTIILSAPHSVQFVEPIAKIETQRLSTYE